MNKIKHNSQATKNQIHEDKLKQLNEEKKLFRGD
jgi:hypothetical protein